MKTFKRVAICCLVVASVFCGANAQTSGKKVLRLAVAGVSHGHASFILGRKPVGDFELVGVFETNKELVQSYATRYKFSTGIIYNDLAKMLDTVKPDAVVAFGCIFDHMAVVEAAAPRGIHVMVEKPLATTVEDANRMAALAKKYNIHILTNYETSWYPSTAKAFELVNDSSFVGDLRKVVTHDGHQGPQEIGVGKEFLEWLTDPILNGGGALIDFGCYGANLMTCLVEGDVPVSVTAVTQQIKPDVYPRVEDEATIILTYRRSQCIIQASWNWPFNRKDMEIYGNKGLIYALDKNKMVIRNEQSQSEKNVTVTSADVNVYEDPFAYFADVIRGKITVPEFGLYSLENNVLVVKILDAARRSATEGKTVKL